MVSFGVYRIVLYVVEYIFVYTIVKSIRMFWLMAGAGGFQFEIDKVMRRRGISSGLIGALGIEEEIHEALEEGVLGGFGGGLPYVSRGLGTAPRAIGRVYVPFWKLQSLGFRGFARVFPSVLR